MFLISYLKTTRLVILLTRLHLSYPLLFNIMSNDQHLYTSTQFTIFCYYAGFDFHGKTQFWI